MGDAGLATQLAMLAHVAGAMLLGWLVGYERYYNGRVAGTQVYCLVCMTACAITYLTGFPQLWYGHNDPNANGDLTRVIGSIMTGIGFLGAGILMQSGNNVRGLTTAASLWSSTAIGILVGANFYVAAVGLTMLFMMCTVAVAKLERRLPAQAAFAVSLTYKAGYRPDAPHVNAFLGARGLVIPPGSISVSFNSDRFELQCLVLANSSHRMSAIADIAADLPAISHVESFTLSPTSRT